MNQQATRKVRWPLILGGALLCIGLVVVVLFQYAVHLLKGQVEEALGPKAEVQEIRVGLMGVELLGIRLPAGREPGSAAWPTEDLLRADRVLVEPSIADLFNARIVLRRIRVEGGYLSMLRTRSGKLRVLPSLTEQAVQSGDAQKSTGPEVSLGRVELVDCAVEFFDASVGRKPVKIRLEQLQTRLGPLQLPGLQGRSQLSLKGVVKGIRQDGQVQLEGDVELATRESDITSRLRGVDLTVFQPYLIKAAETGIRGGTMDLDLHTKVQKGYLHGPGTLSVKQLELESGSNTFMGMPRSAVVSMMADRKGEIRIQFVLEGNVNDPGFSLNENLMTRVGAAMAEGLGISLEGLTRGVGGAGGSVVRGLGESLNKLFK